MLEAKKKIPETATIVKAGNPLLKSEAAPITEFGSKELSEFIEFLFHSMDHHKGIGLAAPQVGEGKQIFVYGVEKSIRYPDAPRIPRSVLINPEIIAYSDEKIDLYEGCLSVPRIRGLVPRASSITVKAYTFEGESFEKTMEGFEARIIQHELDHLKGILFPMRMQDISTLKYTEN